MDTLLDNLKQSLAAVVRAMVGTRLDYLALYPCKVVKQNSDLTLELMPDEDRIPPMSNVPIRSGVAGATVKVSPGTRVLLGWSGGDPQKPMATVWEPVGTVVELHLDAETIILNGGSAKVGRVGDQVQVTVPPGTFTVSATGSVNNLVPVTLTGQITAGAPGVKA